MVLKECKKRSKTKLTFEKKIQISRNVSSLIASYHVLQRTEARAQEKKISHAQSRKLRKVIKQERQLIHFCQYEYGTNSKHQRCCT
jgi:hypothetical protein